MTPMIPAVVGMLLVGGVLGLLTGLRKVPDVAHPVHVRRRRPWRAWTRRQLVVLGVSIVAGVLVALLTGWVLAIVVVPVVAVGVPRLLAVPHERDVIERLEALAEWTRHLSGVIRVGAGLERALIETLPSTPEPIRPEVAALVARLRAKWDTEDAVRAFAADLHDPTGDLVAATLILATHTRGDGLSTILSGLAESVGSEVTARRQLEAERAKPRQNARVVTIITIGALLALAFTGQFLDAYKSPPGQVALAVMLAAYAAVLVMMRRMAEVRALPRFLEGRRP